MPTETTHEIHTSERRSFLCRQRWHWSYREKLQPVVTPRPLQFGTAFHKGLETFYDPEHWDKRNVYEKYMHAKNSMDQCILEQKAEFLSATGQENISVAFGDDYDERLELAQGMLKHYAFKVHPIVDKKYRPVMVEVPFRVPLYDPDDLTEIIYCDNSPRCGQVHDNPAPITLDGRVDAIFEEIGTGGYWIVDHKTAASLMPNDDWLQRDDQISSYAVALQLMMNVDIKGFIYNEIRKAYPKNLRPLTRRYEGKLLSTNKTQLTDYDTALEHISSYDNEGLFAGAYDDYLEYLQSDEAPKFYSRFEIPQSNRRLAFVHKIISRQALDMVDPDIRIYPQVAKQNCGWCAFAVPCASMFEGENYEHALNTLYKKKDA